MNHCKALLFAAAITMAPVLAHAQNVTNSPELYSGEKDLYEAARKEGMVAVSYTHLTLPTNREV